MLRCKDVARRASALIDGDLSSWEVLQMRMHLAICKGCNAFVDQMRTTAALSDMASNPASVSDTDTARMEAILSNVLKHRKSGK
jgi:anti-sigma factor RsiW